MRDGEPDPGKFGRPWSDDELDAIVTDYFAMLDNELNRRSYVKAHHSAALMAQIGRSHRSVEFKHQNISAVLEELGLPRIAGYRPARNFQNAIFPAIERYLEHHPSLLTETPVQPPAPQLPEGIFVAPPELRLANEPRAPSLERLVRKFDPVARDHHNRALGAAGESFVLSLEQARLRAADRPDLARRVRWVSAEDGDGAGFDILSFLPDGAERLIEVKTTNGGLRTPFFLSRVEKEVADERRDSWRLYRLHAFAQDPRIFTLTPPLEDALRLRTETWRASF